MFAALAIAAASFVPAHADGTTIFASSGDRSINSFTTPVAVVAVGDNLTFLNGDVQPHGLASDAVGAQDRPWCGFFDAGQCPLFWAAVTDAGFRSNPVKGTDQLVAGQTYGFHCTVHPNMRGTLIAV
jgi:plastocyanin